jgi:preprotein translocase subunit SecE
MALNREQKRQLQRSGKLDEDVEVDGGAGGNGDGGPPRRGSGGSGDDDGSSRKGRATPTRAHEAKEERTSPRQFVREVRSELRKVAWPTRSETLNYSFIVAIALAFMTALIFGLDWFFGEVVLRIFQAR